jgi:diaminohydroxyphosphoribosylaminopyrimidine deaminase/5-amino-6-(5-phosphoribosylamino)uracil reductase
MAQALALGAQAEGCTSPNPLVGCLVVRDDRLVGRGCHRAAGEPHAEAMAIDDAGTSAEGATLYVNLEPCAHHGRTPPCADLIIRRGLRRVVAAMQDPNPIVNGTGFARLRAAGVQVEVGLLGEEAQRLNEPFVHWHAHGRPMVTVKAAISADGMLSAARGVSKWITGPLARRFAHYLRRMHDAVLVGAETVRQDDPRLTVRLAGRPVSRIRVVLSRSLELDPASRIFDGEAGPTRVYTTTDVDEHQVRRLADKAEIVRLPAAGGSLSFEAVLSDLGSLGIQSLLVEGGARTLAGIINAGLAQRAAVFQAPQLLGARGGTPLLDAPTVSEPAAGWRVRREQIVPMGPDLLVIGRLELPRRER